MKATLMYAAGDVRVQNVPDAVVEQPTDALVRITTTCICGSDLHPYGSMPSEDGPARMGHEFLGVVEDVGSQVSTVRRGDFVVAPFAYADGACVYCREGLVFGTGYHAAVRGGVNQRTRLDGVPDGYRAMAERESLKALVTP